MVLGVCVCGLGLSNGLLWVTVDASIVDCFGYAKVGHGFARDVHRIFFVFAMGILRTGLYGHCQVQRLHGFGLWCSFPALGLEGFMA